MNWTLLGGSLAAVLALGGIAWALGLGGIDPLDEASARAMAEQLVPGFVALHVALDQDGGAVVTGASGERVTLRRHGARWVHEHHGRSEEPSPGSEAGATRKTPSSPRA